MYFRIMASSLSRFKKNRKLYHNQIEVFTEPSTVKSETNKSTLWVESKEIDWSFRSKQQASSKSPAQKPAQTRASRQAEIDQEKSENTATDVSYEPESPSLDEPDEENNDESPAVSYVIIGFDTEYVSRKLRRLKTINEAGDERIIGWLPYTDTDGETELGDDIISIDPDKNPEWRQQLAAKKNRSSSSMPRPASRSHRPSSQSKTSFYPTSSGPRRVEVMSGTVSVFHVHARSPKRKLMAP